MCTRVEDAVNDGAQVYFTLSECSVEALSQHRDAQRISASVSTS